jgi:hypothetical protein
MTIPSLSPEHSDDLLVRSPRGPASDGRDAGSLADQVASLTQEVEALKAKVGLLLDLERYRDLILARHPAVSVALSSGARIDARDMLDGMEGFYALEYDKAGTAFRWTGPGHFARIRFQISRAAPIRIVLHVVSLGKNRPEDPFTVDVAGKVYPLRADGDGRRLAAGPIPPAEAEGPVDAFIHVPTIFSLHAGETTDRRSLGIAISAIDVEPAL